MRKFVVLSEKSWHKSLHSSLQKKFKEVDWILIDKKAEFSFEELAKLQPEKVFIPHWSHIIPPRIFSNFECIVFHMTDLPFGRGGSPLQNLIASGHTKTKISAIRVEKGLDTGPVYLKEDLQLLGTAQEIFIRSSNVVEEMIFEIVEKDLKPISQEGEVVEFKRRKPEQGNISNLEEANKIFDYIRMLDCEGYPPAFIETSNFRFEFTRASLKSEKEIIADVRIIKK
ncbi:formyltransferase family protein [Salinimicrobium sp. TH3]|uniref:formyltransferase family protein n=1 Tax=Salinimicrobium sp. TH3 TaxID=2997342 RepID=UPI002275818B|nr:formyltransferase family protein [Salinimicrobium sp. TH3]MCY2686958.1 formyltransferase family protein [Salinimicrobium sp. TH3]